MTGSNHLLFTRRLLLIEVERYCLFSGCEAKVSVALTKQEAIDYRGFRCSACERWNDDYLTEKDVPEWWADLGRL